MSLFICFFIYFKCVKNVNVFNNYVEFDFVFSDE